MGHPVFPILHHPLVILFQGTRNEQEKLLRLWRRRGGAAALSRGRTGVGQRQLPQPNLAHAVRREQPRLGREGSLGY